MNKEIIYFLKKGLQVYPPCFAQVMMLNDLDIPIKIYHGKNSEYINRVLDNRKIEHYEFVSDGNSVGRIDSAVRFLKFEIEFRAIVKQYKSKDCIFWFGNAETAISLDISILRSKKFILSVLELYDTGSFIENRLRKLLTQAKIIICCEKHRAAIMKSRYGVKNIFVMPNKPYSIDEITCKSEISDMLSHNNRDKYIVYQGIISNDRPLENVIRAVKSLDNTHYKVLLLGNGDITYINSLQKIYKGVVYGGYLPAPQHLQVTKFCYIGIAMYNGNKMNNVFCAPNKIFEYAGFGLPIIASDCIALEESVEDTHSGICVNFENLEEIKKAFVEIIDNYDFYSGNAVELYQSVDNVNIMKRIVNELELI